MVKMPGPGSLVWRFWPTLIGTCGSSRRMVLAGGYDGVAPGGQPLQRGPPPSSARTTVTKRPSGVTSATGSLSVLVLRFDANGTAADVTKDVSADGCARPSGCASAGSLGSTSR